MIEYKAQIRKFEKPDFNAVKRVYQQGIDTRQATFQLSAKSWEEWDDAMLSHCRLVAVNNKTVVGWAALSAVSSRVVYAGVAEVSIYISPDYNGRGVGSLLMATLIHESENIGIWTLQSSVFPENEASIALHIKHGFRELGTRERIALHHGQWRDTVLLERRSSVVG